MSTKHIFQETFPAAFFLEVGQPQALTTFLASHQRLLPGESVLTTEKPGEGNMNFVLRIITNQRSFILKQARPWVEKYPQIAAPVQRSEIETLFYEKIQSNKLLADFSPRLLWSDPGHFMLALEDLGTSADYSFIYRKGEKIDTASLNDAIRFLRQLHQLPVSVFPLNMEMRRLNHEHIFHFPFEEGNGLDLNTIQPGLAETAQPFKKDALLKKKITRLGEIYLNQGRSLLHGDFYPGSWLNTNQGIKIIDPEFAFHGPPEFDLAIMVAHMLMAEQGIASIQQIWSDYQAPVNFDQGLLSAFTGVEIMRRLIGIAQLPLSLSIADKINLLAKASEWIRRENLLDNLRIY